MASAPHLVEYRQGYNAESDKLTEMSHSATLGEKVLNKSWAGIGYILLGSAILPVFMGSTVFGQSRNSPTGDLALVGGTINVSPTEEPIRDGVVLIQGEKIAAVGRIAVPRAAEPLDCSGLT